MAKSSQSTKNLLAATVGVLATLATMGAGLASILKFAKDEGLVDPSSYLAGLAKSAAWVRLTPASDTARALGDSLHFAATVSDSNGLVISGLPLVWTTDDSSVVQVLRDGTAIALKSGEAAVIASSGTLSARSRAVVRQQVASVRIGSDSVLAFGERERRPAPLFAYDARGRVVPGRSAVWRSSDPSTLEIDSAGQATGVNPGVATLFASLDGLSAQVRVTVYALPGALQAVSGDDQRGLAGAALPQPLVVRLVSRRGRPMEGAIVRVRSADGSGAATPDSASTDRDGKARFRWSLGDHPGRQTLVVGADQLDSTLAVVAEADPVRANTRTVATGTDLGGPASAELAAPVGVRLTDTAGRALPDVPVTWTVSQGTVAPLAPRTDSLGEAHARWMLGPRTGRQQLRVLFGSGRSVPPLIVTATATAGPVAAAKIASGDAQRGAAGVELPMPAVLLVLDQAGNPVPGARLTVKAETGRVLEGELTTDSAGLARVHWTLARLPGPQKLLVRVAGITSPLTLAAVAVPGPAANLAFVAPPAAGAAGGSARAVVEITDQLGNAVPDVPVAFTVKSGAVTPARGVTDKKGRFATTWTLGRLPGDQTLTARVPGADVRARLTIPAAGTSKRKQPS